MRKLLPVVGLLALLAAPGRAQVCGAGAAGSDFGDAAKYRDADAKLGSPAPEENRVVFFGDSITEYWNLAEFFPGKPYVDRGIAGQTTLQMRLRFCQDVLALKPKVVVVLAGTNDIAGNTGAETLATIEGNLADFAQLARNDGIAVVMASVLPVAKYGWRPEVQPVAEILSLNAWIKDYAMNQGHVYLDYYSALADENHGMKKDLAVDGVHPSRSGYEVMAPLAEEAIARARR